MACLLSTAVSAVEPSPKLSGRFLHITDIHPDEHYLDGAAVSTSCHAVLGSVDATGQGAFNLPARASGKERVLTVEDMQILRPGVTENDGISAPGTAGHYGAPYTICDSPLSLANATFEWIDNNLVGGIDFVVWTGDNARHDSDNTHPRTQDQINEMNNAMAKRALQAFPPGPDGRRLPVIPSLGNNDVYPHNIMYPGPSAILDHYADIWSEWIPKSQMSTFRLGGYYSSEVIPGKVAVFGLNTLFFYIHNVAVDGCKKRHEPGTEEMDWLEAELKSLRSRKMVAYLTGHVPPEKKSYSASCHSRYTKLALEYQDVIVGHLYGHANIDHFFLLSTNKKGKDRYETLEDGDQDQDQDMDMDIDDEDKDDEYDPFHILGLGTYLDSLWQQYDSIPKKVKSSTYAIVQVSPSVVPAYHPTLRVFDYQLADNSTVTLSTDPADEDDDVEDEMDDHELEEYFSAQLNNDNEFVRAMEQDKKKGDKKPSYPNPVPTNAFGFPMAYTQYWTNLTLANHGPTTPEFEVEYRTREDYGLANLGVSEYLGLAKRISKDKQLKKVYLKRMVVQTGAENTL
ncbi:Endopolyphosphatase [Dissophora globulifera]|uniref:Endopolyphosphatase n=1 Tax=Dissophora globulifera TaxID=979702 RepID=A0A9P6URN5_9FUNG|nr:Endopolyphosphatase [Dissophora globulifera]